MSTAKTTEVTAFLKYFVDSTMIFTTDDEGYVINSQTEERIAVQDKTVQKQLLLYQEEIPNADICILNPLAEGHGDTPGSIWFIDVLKSAMLGKFLALIRSVSKTALEEKKSKKDTNKNSHIPMELLTVASKIIDDVDEKFLEEIETIAGDAEAREFLNIYYQKKQLRSVLRCALFDEEIENVASWKSRFPVNKVRKKTWSILERIVLALLNIKDKDELLKFNKRAPEISCARLSSLLSVLFAIYQEINPLLDIVTPDIALDLSKFANHLNRLTDYSDNAKFAIQVTKSPTAPVAQQSIHAALGQAPLYAAPTSGYGNAPQTPINNGVLPDFAFNADKPQNYGYQPHPPQQYTGYGQPPSVGYQQPAPGYYQPPPQSIPFSPPYVNTPSYLSNGAPNISLYPPGMPGGFNPMFR